MRESKAEIKQQQAPVAARMEDFDAAVYWPPRSDGNCLKPPEKNREQQQNSNTGDINLLREMNELLEATNPISNLMIVFFCALLCSRREIFRFFAVLPQNIIFCGSDTPSVLVCWLTQKPKGPTRITIEVNVSEIWGVRKFECSSSSSGLWSHHTSPSRSCSFFLALLCCLAHMRKKLTHKFYENWNFGQASAAADASVRKSWKNRKLFFGYSGIPSRTGNWI